jgi:hypothetical protein
MIRSLCLVLFVGCAAAGGCGRSPMDMIVHATGSGGNAASPGGTGGATLPGPCGNAICLTELFATCEPAGDCSFHGGSSPSAVFGTVCYANGVTVSYMGGDTGGGVSSELTVRRGTVLCYSIESSSSPEVSALTLVIRDGNGKVIATAITADKEGHDTVTCEGKPATTVDRDCLVRVGDTSGCGSEPCP